MQVRSRNQWPNGKMWVFVGEYPTVIIYYITHAGYSPISLRGPGKCAFRGVKLAMFFSSFSAVVKNMSRNLNLDS